MPVRFARPGHEVLSIVPGDVGSGRSKMPAVASAESEPERICREMGTLGEAGVPVTVDSVWRRLAQASSPAIYSTLPGRAEPSRKEQPLAVPRRGGQTDPRAASDSLQGAAWRASEVLSPPCRLSILTIRAQAADTELPGSGPSGTGQSSRKTPRYVYPRCLCETIKGILICTCSPGNAFSATIVP